MIAIQLILKIGFLRSIGGQFETQHLVLGLLTLFIVIFLGGALAGAIGAYALSRAIQAENPKRIIASSAIGVGFGFVVVLLPITVLLSSVSMYNNGEASLLGFLLAMGLVGALFGLVCGFMTGILPSRVNIWHVTGVAMLAFGLAGIIFGLGLWNYFYLSYQGRTATPALLLAFLVFGGAGGFVLGWMFSLDRERTLQEGVAHLPIQGNIFYRLGHWFKTTKFYTKRGFWGTVTFLLLWFVILRIVSISPLNVTPANISDFLPSNTIGVHWSAPSVVSNSQTDHTNADVSSKGGLLAVVWEDNGDVFLEISESAGQTQPAWSSPINLSQTTENASSSPQTVVDKNKRDHIVWSEGSSAIFYRSCMEVRVFEIEGICNRHYLIHHHT